MGALAPVEWVGLLIAALLVGALVGGFLAARAYRLSRRAAHEERFIHALIGWLASRRKWREAAMRMVRSVRRLAQTSKSDSQFQLRCKAARRARKRFRKSQDELTIAQARMETWRGDALHGLSEVPPQPTALQVRRAAIRGGADRLEWLQRRMQLADEADLEWVRAERVQLRAGRSLASHFSVWIQGMVYKVVRTWERPR